MERPHETETHKSEGIVHKLLNMQFEQYISGSRTVLFKHIYTESTEKKMNDKRFKYRDIIDKERPVHDGDEFEARHPKMPREARAKIFAPFAALKGYEEAIDDTADSHESEYERDSDIS